MHTIKIEVLSICLINTMYICFYKLLTILNIFNVRSSVNIKMEEIVPVKNLKLIQLSREY